MHIECLFFIFQNKLQLSKSFKKYLKIKDSFFKKKSLSPNITSKCMQKCPWGVKHGHAGFLCALHSVCFNIKVFWKTSHFSKIIFLENYLIFMCLVATLKVSWKAFHGAWYALYVNVYLNAY